MERPLGREPPYTSFSFTDAELLLSLYFASKSLPQNVCQIHCYDHLDGALARCCAPSHVSAISFSRVLMAPCIHRPVQGPVLAAEDNARGSVDHHERISPDVLDGDALTRDAFSDQPLNSPVDVLGAGYGGPSSAFGHVVPFS